MNLKEFKDSGKYLPPILRDFHNQKDVFKLIHQTINVEKHEYAGDISWVKGHCYVIDIFLWAMANYGYTLQKSRAKVDFKDIHAATEQNRKGYAERFNEMFRESQEEPK